MTFPRLAGLIAATYTPFSPDGSLNCTTIPSLVDHLLSQDLAGLYVCGSTGEGMSLTSDERIEVTASYVRAVAGRVPVVAQVGHNSVKEAKQLASAAQDSGVAAISATCPSYFKVDDVSTLVACMAEIASGAPELPFYYYHIPALTGSTIDMISFLQQAKESIPNLAGLKYTDTRLHEFQQCLEQDGGGFDVVWGCDEMLLGALATGAKGAIGSTYNVAASLYGRIIDEFEQGSLTTAQSLQSLSIQLIRIMNRYPFHAAMKALLAMQGYPVGGCRLPMGCLSQSDLSSLRSELTSIEFFRWSELEAGELASIANRWATHPSN